MTYRSDGGEQIDLFQSVLGNMVGKDAKEVNI